MRQGEIYNIRKHDINFKDQTLLIPQTKTDTPRTIFSFVQKSVKYAYRATESVREGSPAG